MKPKNIFSKLTHPISLRAMKVALKNKVIRYVVPFLLSAFCFLLFDTVIYGQNPNCFRITFSDKNESPYSINRPEEFLSPRAIAKRERFNIPVTVEDLPVNPQYIEAITSSINTPISVISTSKWNNSVVICFKGSGDYQNAVDKMVENFPFIESVLPVAYYDLAENYKTPIHEQSSESIVYQSSCDYDYGNSINNISLHKGDLLHKAGFCGEGMLICVIDAGWNNFDKLSYFKPLYDNGQIWGTRDLAPGVNNVYTGHGHGTAITSEMASSIDGRMVGTAPKANYYFIRSENPWSEQLVEEDFYAQAIEIADSLGADVSTASLGYTTFDTIYKWQDIYTPADNDGTKSIASRAASILTKKGVIVVNAAGNEGWSSWHYIGRPADAFDILAVGAVNRNGVIAGYSSYGPSADGRIKPDVASPGDYAWVIDEYGSFGQANGTSCAAPIIAGLSACLWQAMPDKTSLELMQLIREYSDSYNNPNDRTGYGIPNFYKIYYEYVNDVTENKIPEFSVYPNPTTGELRILTRGHDPLSIPIAIEIFDIYGRNVTAKFPSNELEGWQPQADGVVFNISHFPAGIYFVRIQTESGTITKKVVKY